MNIRVIIVLGLFVGLLGCGQNQDHIGSYDSTNTEIVTKGTVSDDEVNEQNDVIINMNQTEGEEISKNEELFDCYEDAYDMIIKERASFDTEKAAYTYISSVYEELWPGEYGYQLVDFDGDDVRELVVCSYDYPFFSMYSYKSGLIYPLINMWNIGNSQEDCFMEGKGIIRSFRKSGESKESVFIIRETTEGILQLDYELIIEFDGEKQTFYLLKDGVKEGISEDKYNTLWLDGEKFTLFDGDKSFDELW